MNAREKATEITEDRAPGEKPPPCCSRQPMPPPLPAVNPVGHRRPCPWLAAPGRGMARGPLARPTPPHSARATPSASSPRPHLPGGNQGKTHQPHGTTRPRSAPTAASRGLQQGRDSSSASAQTRHRHGTDTPVTRPRPRGRRASHADLGTDPNAQTPLLTHSAACNDETTLPGSGTALPGPPGAPGPAWPGPTRLGRP